MPDAGGDGLSRLFGSILVVADASGTSLQGVGGGRAQTAELRYIAPFLLTPTGPLSDVDLSLIFPC
jgi:hypothetical protein